MNKCVKIVARCETYVLLLIRDAAETAAREQFIEGVLYMKMPHHLEMIVAGSKERVDAFIDVLYRATAEHAAIDIEIEPTFKERDYRGVFRVIQ